jgi:hypothetical protein
LRPFETQDLAAKKAAEALALASAGAYIRV